MIGRMEPADSTTENARAAAGLRLDVSAVRLTPADRQPVAATPTRSLRSLGT
jgi:hypothetical protein